MKGRDSGMPEEEYWNSFFDAECIIKKMFLKKKCQGNVVEFGSGYGTFTFPASMHSMGTVFAFDIEPELIQLLRQRAKEHSLTNVRAEVRDFVANGTGLESGTQSHAMIFNLLHLENPVALLKEAHRILHIGGKLSVIHWRSDISTPRGPSLEIRPTPDQCKEWIEVAGFHTIQDVDLSECCQFHFGVVSLC